MVFLPPNMGSIYTWALLKMQIWLQHPTFLLPWSPAPWHSPGSAAFPGLSPPPSLSDSHFTQLETSTYTVLVHFLTWCLLTLLQRDLSLPLFAQFLIIPSAECMASRSVLCIRALYPILCTSPGPVPVSWAPWTFYTWWNFSESTSNVLVGRDSVFFLYLLLSTESVMK